VGKSLLRYNPGGRYTRHGLVVQYAREKLALEQQEQLGAEARHARYYLRLLAERGDEIRGPRGKEALSELDMEFANFRVAWTWAIRTQDVVAVQGVIDQLSLYYNHRARFLEGFTSFGEAARALDAQNPAHQQTLGDLLIRQGWARDASGALRDGERVVRAGSDLRLAF
jgi:hypothetical protein